MVLVSFLSIVDAFAIMDNKPPVEQDPPSRIAVRVEDLNSIEKDSQYPNIPDAIPTIPAEIDKNNKKELSDNSFGNSWYEGMEACGVDVSF